MRLLPKLTLGIVAASAVPLAVVGMVSARLSEEALREKILQHHAALAAGAADAAARSFADVTGALTLVPQLLDLDRATPEVVTGALRLAFRSHEDIAAVALLDERGGERVPAVYLSDPAAAGSLGRPVVTPADAAAFLLRVPREAAVARGSASGPVADRRAAVAVAFRGTEQRSLLAADVNLDGLAERLGKLSAGGSEVILVDPSRRAVRGRAAVAVPGGQPDSPLPAAASVATIGDALTAYAPVPGTELGVVVRQPEAIAFARVHELERRLIYWIIASGLIALAVGVGFARDVGRRIRALAARTAAVSRGDYDKQLDENGKDEISDLAVSFNRMSGEIRKQNVEIRVWNAELEERVADKTRELERAQELLLRARSLAAVATLGAGMAHEINNPLCGLLGTTQLLLLETAHGTPARKLLEDIEAEAQRIRTIVDRLLALAELDQGEGIQPVDLRRVIEEAIQKIGADELARAHIELRRDFAEVPPVWGSPILLQEAMVELMTNARRAMPDGGKITFVTSTPDRRLVEVRVTDTGRGIDPGVMDKIFDPFFTTKDEWRSTGLGLTLVHRIVSQHRGTIAVDSRVGAGATFTMTFPTGAVRRHLD
jgi:signal transduction histidine kinase